MFKYSMCLFCCDVLVLLECSRRCRVVWLKEMRWRRKDVDRGSSWTIAMRLPNPFTRSNPSLPQTPVVSIEIGMKSMCWGKSAYLLLFLVSASAATLLLLLYWYCIYAFLANCRKGACGYVQCWKSSVLSSFFKHRKSYIRVLQTRRETVPSCWTSVKESTRANCLGGGGWHKQVTGRRRSQV